MDKFYDVIMWNKIIDISSKATKQWKSILLIYIVQLLLGIIVAMTAYRQFNSAIGCSLELDRLANGFDRSIFSDMINDVPTIIGQIQSRFGLVVLLFLFLSVFLHAGLLGNIRNDNNSVSTFFRNAKRYYFRFLGVALVSLLKMIFILAIIWVPFFKWLGNPLETFHSEKTFILSVVGLIILSVLFIIIIWLWSVLVRYQVIDDNGFILSMKSGWLILKTNFIRYYVIGIALILLHALITWLYTLTISDWGAETWFCVLGLIFIQQIFSMIRIWIRALGFSAMNGQSS